MLIEKILNMNNTLEDWLIILNSVDNTQDLISTECLEYEGKLFTSALLNLIEKELVILAITAKQHSDVYWIASQSARQEANNEKQCRVGTRVRLVGSSLVAEWYRNRFVENGSNVKKVFSTYIKKGRNDHYSMCHFKNEPPWAKEIIAIVEDRYSLIRQRANALTKIRRALNEYEKILEKSYGEQL